MIRNIDLPDVLTKDFPEALKDKLSEEEYGKLFLYLEKHNCLDINNFDPEQWPYSFDDIRRSYLGYLEHFRFIKIMARAKWLKKEVKNDVVCDCGKTVKSVSYKNHLKSQYHRLWESKK